MPLPRSLVWLLAAQGVVLGCADDGAGGSGAVVGAGGSGAGAASGGSSNTGPVLSCDLGCGQELVCDLESGQCKKEGLTVVVAADGTKLSTWVALPQDVPAEGVPALLSRTPYGSPYSEVNEEFYRDMGRVHTARGYAYVLQDVRGRGKSEGEFIPETYEIVDGRTTSEWMAAQPWSNGRLGTIGGSYLGYTALAAAVDNPLVQVVIADDPSNDERTTRPGGTVWTYTLGWVHYLENASLPPQQAYLELPDEQDLMSADSFLLGHDLPYWNEILLHEDIGPWPAGSLDLVAEDVCVPTLFVYSSTTLWRDPLTAYRAFRDLGCPERAAEQRLVMTHDPHVYHLSSLGYEETPVTELMFATLDNYLKADGAPLPNAPVILNAPGESEYLDAAVYPAAGERVLFLGSGTLADTASAPSSVSLESDPETMSPCGGTYPYLEFASEPLSDSMLVLGEPTLTLTVNTALADFDLFASLYEFNPAIEGGGRFVQIGSQRATYREGTSPSALPGEGVDVPITIELLPVAHRVLVGSQLVLYLSTADCVAFENPQSGEPAWAQTEQVAGELVLRLDANSRLSLPLLE
jgi:predicted acyl esterase